ncbi:MAG: hypothetical protein H6555_05230 [Lewinellaceae bacterium]|nr:hypothetical protein [Lewinellaceae bacterium]
MCSSHSHHTRYEYRQQHRHHYYRSPKARFLKQVRSFLVFQLVMTVLFITGHGMIGLWKISMFWAIGLGIGYIRHFGWPGAEGFLSNDYLEWLDEKDRQKGDTPTEDPSPKKASWRDRDLV